MTRAKNGQQGTVLSHGKQLPRLKRIEGQVRGVQRMVEADEYCRECANAALTGKLPAAKARRLTDEIGELLAKWG